MLKKFIAPLLVSFLISFQSFGSHVTGGFFSYECLGNDEYLVTLTLFRDCSGITMPTSVFVDFNSTCGAALPGVQLDMDQTLLPPGTVITADGGGHISQVCVPQLQQTTCYGGTIPGNEMYVYQATVTLNPPCNSWTMGWSTCCRNTTVNVPTSNGDGVYIEATLNSVTAPCNSSPNFLTPYPVYYACANQPTTVNYSIAEPDNDNLVYSLVAAYESQGLNLTYGGGYSGAAPLAGITVDPATGELNFTPTTLGNFIVVLQVEEYDAAGNLIGSNFIDAQVVVQSCPANNTPTASTIQNFSTTNNSLLSGPNSIDMCVNDDFCFDVTFDDVDGDIFSLSSNIDQILPGATVTFDTTVAGTATASVCWTAQPGFTGSTIVIYGNDNACPTPGVVTFSANLNVSLGTYANDGVICGDMEHQFIADGGTIFNWSVVSGDPIVVGTNFSCNPCQTPIATPSQTTTYEVVSNLAGACNNTDQVTVTVTQNMGDIDILDITANPTMACMGDTSRLEVVTNQPPPICDEYTVTSVPFAPIAGSGTAVALGDDWVSTALPIGFNFEFFCNVRTDFYISSNGFITFNAASGSGCCSGQTIPDPWDPNDLIALCWDDLDPDGYGTIEYFTTGTAPNRILVVNFIGISHYPGPGPNNDLTIQAQLHETTNAIEIHTTTQPDGTGFSTTQGIEGPNGVNGFPVPGRNGTGWTATNDAYRFESLNNPPDPYTYAWTNANMLDFDTSYTPLATLNASGVIDFNVTVYDANMCWVDSMVSVTTTNPFGLTSSGITSSCAGVDNGGATIAVNGGIGPFEYLWPSGETTATATGLPPGVQNVTVYDTGAGCSKDTAVTIPASPLGITITGFNSTDASCNGFSDGTATVTSTNGSGGLVYDWGPDISSSTAFAGNIPPGTHTLVISDIVGCYDDTTFTIDVPAVLSVTGQTLTTSTCNQTNGGATIDGVIGGPSSAYTYLWDNGQTGSSLSNVASGTFCVTINDVGAAGCYTTHCLTVSTTPFPTASTNSTPTSCNAYADGTSTLSVIPAAGGSTSFTYLWDAGAGFQNTLVATGLGAGVYNVTATDTDGCIATATTTITEPTAVTATATTAQNTICYGQGTTLNASAIGGNGAPYTYTWDDGTVSPTITVSPTSQSFYTVSATDVNGCLGVSMPLMINVKPQIQSIVTQPTSICENTPVDLWVYAWGGNGTFTYTWDNGLGVGASKNVVPSSYPSPTEYIVTISDGCSPDITDTVEISFYTTPEPLITVTDPDGCQPFTTTISPVSSSMQNVATCLWQLQDGTFITDNSCSAFTHTFNVVDYYDVTLSVISNDGCPGTHTEPDMIRVYELPVADFSSTQDPNILDTEVDFDDESYGAVNTWDWTFYHMDGANVLGTSVSQDTSFTYPVDTGYYPVKLYVQTIHGCEDDTIKTIFINGAYMFYVPSGFSPNGDGLNDVFKPVGTGFSKVEGEYTLEIFDRWGKRVYFSQDYEEGWNGKNKNGTGDYVPNGVYVYKITTVKSTERWEDGKLDTTEFEYMGHITFIR